MQRKKAWAIALAAAMSGGAVYATPQDASSGDATTGAVQPSDKSKAAEASTDKATQLNVVSVIGQGETRQVQRVASKDIAPAFPPGTSPQKLLNRLPGVNVESDDPFGSNEESETITLRGFNQSRLGFTLDGIPLGDDAYGNWNGLNISRALTAENIGSIELAEGIGGLGLASTSNLGGTVQYYSSDPAQKPGVRVSQTVGSDQTLRSFVRLDTGNYKGFSMAVSGMRATGKQWADNGQPSHTNQFNIKAKYDFDGGTITAFADYSNTSQADSTDMSKNMVERLGWNWNTYAPDWQRAVNAANGIYSGNVTSLTDAYYKSRALRKDALYYLAGDFYPADDITIHAKVYHHDDKGQGHWWTPYEASSDTIPISIRSSNYWINRTGAILSAEWDIAGQHIEGGVWYEVNHHRIERNYYFINGPINDDNYLSNPNVRLYNQAYDIITRQAFLQDSFKLFDDRLSVDFGVKSPHTSMSAWEVPGFTVTNALATGRLDAGKAFLPEAGLNYKFGGGHEVFASYAQNIAAFQGGGASGPLDVQQAQFNATRGDLKPESSRTLEAGYRYASQTVQFSAAAYSVKFNNRLLSVSPCTAILTNTSSACETRFYNVGSVSSHGAEFTLIWQPSEHFEWYNSASFNRSTYDNNYTSSGEVIDSKGKITVDTPKKLFSSDLTWHYGAWRYDLVGKYTGMRYYTYTNDSPLGGHTSFDTGLSYDFGAINPDFSDVTLSLNVTNLTNKRFPANIAGYAVSDPKGTAQDFEVNAPRQIFGTVDIRF